MKCGMKTVSLGSARDSRAGDGDLAIANFFSGMTSSSCCGESPQPARESRALPRSRAVRNINFQ